MAQMKVFDATNEQVQQVADLIGHTLQDNGVPVPLGILGMERVMDQLEERGIRFQRKSRGVFDVIRNEGT